MEELDKLKEKRKKSIEKKKEYYRKHKNEIQKKLRTKYDCVCGGKYTCWHKSEHEITKRHKIFGGKAKGR